MDRLLHLKESGLDIWNLPKLPYVIGKDKAAILSLDLNFLCVDLGFVYSYSDICDLYWYMFRDEMDVPMLCRRYQMVVDRLVNVQIERKRRLPLSKISPTRNLENYVKLLSNIKN